jgi:WD40 repeat protein/mono/diheme cytochrome c family protein
MRLSTWIVCMLAGFAVASDASAAAPHPSAGRGDLARRAHDVLKTHCYRCHGQEGAVEGGFNYVLDRDRLVNRRKVTPGDASKSAIMKKIVAGKMPPPEVKSRPSADEIAVLHRWIEAGAPGASTAPPRRLIVEADVLEWILTDLEKIDRRARRFTRYFSLVPLYNAGHGDDELRTNRNALAKLVNSLSWHPRVSIPKAIDPAGLVLRIDLRDYQLDANLWNRVLAEYPYGVLQDSGIARAVLVATATRMPVVRADWFVATASRAPLYYELLQIPAALSDLERQLRVDVGTNIQQERVARTGFNGSGISRNNRILERHDAMNGAYWRSYDFEAVPQNLIERNILLPDRRNIFAYPLGPGLGENGFQHAGGEAIFNLPNGLQAYVLVNANNQRINKGPTDIVSDPKRPDRAVEAGLSCINCHARGIIPKDDQLREHVRKNKKAFNRADVEVVEALYPPAKKMRELMDEDAKRFQLAVEKTGNKTTAAEVVMAMTLRYESDVDLQTLAAELGVEPSVLLPKLTATENLTRNVGALRVEGAVVSRQVAVQAFADLVRELKLGIAIEPGRSGESLPDQTGEADPLEAQSSPANATAFSPDGKLAAFASADRSVRIHDIEVSRDLRRCVGHTASVWCVKFSPDGTRLISGSKDGTLRVWDVETARELKKIDAHRDLVSAVAFSPDGKRALSAGYDHEVILWDLGRGEPVGTFSFSGATYIHAVAFSSDGKHALVAGEKTVHLIDAATGKLVRKLEGHGGWVTAVAFSPDDAKILTASDDGTARLWETKTGKSLQVYRGHAGYVKAVALDASRVLTGGSDATVRLYELATGKESRVFRKHSEPIVAVAFAANGKETLSGSRDAIVLPWKIGGGTPVTPTTKIETPSPSTNTDLPVLRPDSVIEVGGTIGSFILSPDRKYLYYLDLTSSMVGRVDTKTRKRDKELGWLEGTKVMALTPNGKMLIAPYAGPKGKFRIGYLQIIDTEPFTKRADQLLSMRPYDLAVSNDEVFLSKIENDWSSLAVFPLTKGKEARDLGTVWGSSFLALSPDTKRLFVSSQGVVPGTLDAFTLSGKDNSVRAPNHDKLSLGGEFVISPDGRYLICKSGTVLRLSAEREEDMKLHARIEPHLALSLDSEGKSAWLVARDGTLRKYSYPEFRLQGRWRAGLTAYQIAVDAKAGVLYVAGFDPRSIADRPRAKGHGDIHVYAIDQLGRK